LVTHPTKGLHIMIRIAATAGEKPEPLAHTWADADGTVIDLSGYSHTAEWVNSEAATSGTVGGTVGGVTGVSTVTLPEAALASSGVCRVDLWVGNGVQRYGAKYMLLIAAAAATAPAI